MAPAFHRGDILLLWNRVSSVEPGDIPVVWFQGDPLPMVHRVVQVFDETSGRPGPGYHKR
jgi:signal peptidase I